jgi:lipopolysaccharide export system protein LptA
MASLSEVSIDACDANNVCTLTGTLTNSDADTTSVTFTTQVKITDGKVRLYGDQLSS